jgi:two-component system, NtrC family, response regulator HupR/HoxA
MATMNPTTVVVPARPAGPWDGLPLVELGSPVVFESKAIRLGRVSSLDGLARRPNAPVPRGRVAQSEGAFVFPEGYIQGPSPAMARLHAQMERLLQADIPALLVGETGVGKEQIAQVLHASSRRRGGPFVPVNCAAIPAELMEAEMFGIGRGVATGVTERRGKFQLAEGGTLFLDEVGEMAPALQAKLLRALQGREIQPVGGAPVAIDVRIVAATNSDLERKMGENLFRRDLYYRLAGVVLRVPPLRERREDVPALVDGLLGAFASEAGLPAPGITDEARRALAAYAWPGNVRELEHEVRRLVYQCPAGREIDVSLLSEHVLQPLPEAGAPATLELRSNIDHLERHLIERALVRTRGKRAAAARLLGISRNGLMIKMERLGLAGR